jgi:hypothetical protein
MKLLQRERTLLSTQSLQIPPPCQDALGDAALRGWIVKWLRSFGIGNSHRGFLLAVTIAIIMVFSLSAAAQNQYYVAATGGSDSNSGTSVGSPWATCNHAIAAFKSGASGAVINFIASNTKHAACSNINRGGSSTSARLVLQCTAPWTADVHCKMAGNFFVTSANNVDIGAMPQLGFEYTNPNDDIALDVVYQCGSSLTCASGNSIHVLGNYFHDVGQNVSGGCPLAGMIEIPNSHGKTLTDTRVIGNLIDHFGTSPNNSCNVAQGIYILTGGAIVQNNIVTRSATAAIQYYDQACNAVISNNVLAASRVGLIVYGGNGCTPGSTTVSNNIIVNNSAGAFNTGFGGANDCASGRSILFSNNLLFGNGGDYNNSQPSCEIRQNQRSENPTATFVRYTGTASGDYHLKPGSVAINGGTRQCTSGGASGCAPSIDLALITRPAQLSLGVFETQGDSNASAPAAPSGLTASVQ